MKTYRPVTKSLRNQQSIDYRNVLTTKEPYKPLTSGFRRGSGRNAFGRITTRHKGGGHKRMYREVDFTYSKKDIPAKIQTIEYDPNRSAFIALAAYNDGAKAYVVVPKSVTVGSTFIVSEKADLLPGNRMMLRNIPVGTFIFNIEIQPGAGAKLVRSAGNYAEVIGHYEGFTQIKMPSTEVRKVMDSSFASIGEVSNGEHYLVNLGKAGRNRWKGVRPTVRGSVMNPVDHPYGGGEGKQRRGTKRPKTSYGKTTGGHKTRRPNRYSNVHIVTRRSNGIRNRDAKL